MRASFLLGPAGSGKTRRCLEEIRTELRRSPEGPPLVFVAPKQATFQLERELLAAPDLPGYTRLHILAFDRLAAFVLAQRDQPPPPLLGEEGRLMVLRALLAAHRDRLTVFRATARLAGFASQLSQLLRELDRCQVTAATLTHAADRTADPTLRDKLTDVALLLDAYHQWLADRHLRDADLVLDAATSALRGSPGQEPASLPLGGLWLDGFAEMTPQEVTLLGAVLAGCERATLCFCLDAAPRGRGHWLSAWGPVAGSFRRLYDRLQEMGRHAVSIEVLDRDAAQTRFAGAPALQHLERHWNVPCPLAGSPSPALRVISCPHPDAEVVCAARSIEDFVRAGGRYREVAVLMRSLEGHHAILRREFGRRGIPFFLDRRESVAHHPLAELTRGALRTVASGWPHAAWFATLKSGLVHPDGRWVDRLENEALARGWSGRRWFSPVEVPGAPALQDALERLRQQILPPFLRFACALAGLPLSPLPPETDPTPNGRELADAIERLWGDLGVEQQLAAWSESRPASTPGRPAMPPAVHTTVWEQMLEWTANLRLAFPTERMPLREWLPVLEAGLAALTVGVIPPALDQVLIGAIDRSRNPDLRRVILLGLNDGVFPAPPPVPQLLTGNERDQLREGGLELAVDRRQLLGRERYYGYIATTRARETLLVTFARRDSADRLLAPSPFIATLQTLFPELAIEPFDETGGTAGNTNTNPDLRTLQTLPTGHPLTTRLLGLTGWTAAEIDRAVGTHCRSPERLSAALAARLHAGCTLRTSISRLEQFAACPFRFLVTAGLRAEERRLFEVDTRQQGSFQHEVLRRFHEELRTEGRPWGSLCAVEARNRIERIAAAVTAEFGDGLLATDNAGILTARGLTRTLQDFVATLVGWMRAHYRLEPLAAELRFGPEGERPSWLIPLDVDIPLELTGQVDRVDVFSPPGTDGAWCVIHDYKSSAHRFDPLLFEHGLQLQLPAYLAAVCAPQPSGDSPPAGSVPLIPAGFFYANLRGEWPSGKHRADALAEGGDAEAYQHHGRFRQDALEVLDARPDGQPGGQFAYTLTKAGTVSGASREALPAGDFTALLHKVRVILQGLGRRILAGEAAVDPWQRGTTATACDRCSYQAICRIDPWTHAYRRLR